MMYMPPQDPSRATLVLVHGGAHGSWCWDRIVPLIEEHGTGLVTMNLPCTDEDAGAATYSEVVLDSLAAVRGPIVLVGHSLAGLVIPLVASRRPVAHQVFLAAFMPIPGMSLSDQQREDRPFFPFPATRAELKQRWYNRCSAEDAEWAFAQTTVQASRPLEEKTPLHEWPSTPSTYVVCSDDRACRPAWAKAASAALFGKAPTLIAEADHSPFLSRPAELARTLLGIADTVATRS